MPIRMNGYACAVYSTLPCVCDLFFSNCVRLCAIFFDKPGMETALKKWGDKVLK